MFSFIRLADALRQDVSYAVRALRRDYRFSTTVIATLALGIGANAALFSLADRLFLRQPPGVERPNDLRRLYRLTNWSVGNVTEIRDEFSYVGYTTIRDAIAPRAGAAVYAPPDSFRIGNDDNATYARGVYASHELLPLLGAKAAIGRTFTADEDRPDNPTHVAVIGHRLWTTRFHGDTSILGRTVSIARQQFTVIGVMRRDFAGVELDPVDVWVPIATYPVKPNTRVPWYKNWDFWTVL
jgi:putative ABC transport system permease protein